MILSGTKLTKKTIDKRLFEDISFVIEEKDKIGILGNNGVGKSTLLKTIMNEVPLDEGTLFIKPGLEISYLPQNPIFDEQNTYFEEVKKKTGETNDFIICAMLDKFGLKDYQRVIYGSSGGEKKRLALAIALLKKCDLLILDEPTNHLDVWMISYLEAYLKKYAKALLMVTHDRYFLERVTKTIWELDNGNLYAYDGNYDSYLQEKITRYEALSANYRKMNAILKKEAVWAALNPQARSTKSRERLEKFHALEESTKELSHNIHANDKSLELSSKNKYLGKKTIIIKDLSVAIGSRSLFEHFSCNLARFERVGIVGPNGSGKTTLFQTILGKYPQVSGTIEIGETVKIGYFSQNAIEMDENKIILDYIKEFGEYIDTTEGRLSASQLLDNYLFTPAIQHMKIKTLSGGEKRRLQLLTVLIQSPNVLLLDEPTNDLDIYTLELLENFLEVFKGAVMVVSHDRYFLDKVVDELFVFEKGEIHRYMTTVQEYLESLPKEEKVVKEKKENQNELPPRFTSKEKKEYDEIEDKMSKIEEQINNLEKSKNEYSSDYVKLMEIDGLVETAKKELDNLMERYIYLDDIAQKIEAYKKQKNK